MRRSVEKGEEEEEEEGGRREKGPTPPVSSIFTRVLPGARSESRRRRRKSGRGADWWLPEGLLILWKSAPPRHIWNLPTPVSRRKEEGGTPLRNSACRHPLDYTRLSSASFPREGGRERGMLSVENFLPYAPFGIFNLPRMGFWMISLKRSLFYEGWGEVGLWGFFVIEWRSLGVLFLFFFLSFLFFEKLDLEFIFNLSANVGEIRVFRVDRINF